MHIKGVLLALALTAPATLTMLPPTAHAADGTLYEVSEAIDLKSNGKGFKSSEATLSGTIKAGTPLCPSRVAKKLGTDSCWMIVHATGGADDTTGVGPVRGTIFVLAEYKNAADCAGAQAPVRRLRWPARSVAGVLPADAAGHDHRQVLGQGREGLDHGRL